MTAGNTPSNDTSRPEASAELHPRPERRLIRRAGDFRHVDFALRVSAPPVGSNPDRLPLTLALVLDRSGSMSGQKLPTAKKAALAVLDRLEPRDSVAVVVFDDRIDTLQTAAPATSDLKAHVRAALAEIEARGSTALHEGWLTGCQAITRDDVLTGERLARCFLLTDGLANVGVSDPEQIATDARGLRERAGISTSTFGIGDDYAEELLGPMAVGGSGQFHHLRTPAEIANTFVGELGEMLAVALTQARLELEVRPGVLVEVVSAYTARPAANDPSLWTIALGDLLAGEEPHVVVRFGLPKCDLDDELPLRARLVWMAQGQERATDWHEVRFTYAGDDACDAEQPDPEAARVIGEHLADLANRDAIRMSKTGDLAGAQVRLRTTSAQLAAYAISAPSLSAEIAEMATSEDLIMRRALSPGMAKERYFTAQRRSSGKRDLRDSSPTPPSVVAETEHDATERLLARYIHVNPTWPEPTPSAPDAALLRDGARGALLWGAVGNALGQATDGLNSAEIHARFGPSGLDRYIPPMGWRSGPQGTLTSDAQQMLVVAQCLQANDGRLAPADLAAKLVEWAEIGTRTGRGTANAIARLRFDPWWEAGPRVNSAGNGAATRAAPVGIVHALDSQPLDLRRDAILSALPTHAHPIGVAGAVALAAGVAQLLRLRQAGETTLDPARFAAFIGGAIAGIEPTATSDQQPGGVGARLVERIAAVPALLAQSPDEVFAALGNGAYALESVPAALYCFLRSPEDPRAAILLAVNAGNDADSVACMAGQLAGAWSGAARLEADAPDWWAGLERRDEIITLGDALAALASRG